MKKITSLFLALALCLSLCTVTAFADAQKIGSSNVTWELTENNTKLTISGTGAMPDFTTYADRPWNDNCALVTTVSISSGVTTIGTNAFAECSNLVSVSIPNSVTSIGSYAFYQAGLTSVTIPNSVTDIGIAAFRECSNLTSISLPNNIEIISGQLFTRDTSLVSVTIPASVNRIDPYAFSLTGLTSITVEAATPPTLSEEPVDNNANAFSGLTTNPTIYVPATSVENYKTAAGWSAYAGKIEAIPTYYTVTFDANGHGTVTAKPVKAASGTNVTLTVTPENGYQLKSLKCEKEMTVANLLAALNFPTAYDSSTWVNTENSNYKLYYAFTKRAATAANSSGEYALLAAGDEISSVGFFAIASVAFTPVNGGYKTDTSAAYNFGNTSTFMVDANQQITSINIVDHNNTYSGTYTPTSTLPKVNWEVSLTQQPDGTYTFAMPAANVTVTAEFEAKPTPHHHSSTTTTPTVTSATTADAGIAIYGVLSVSSLLGMGWVAKRKH